MMITILTPSYNRAHLLNRVYKSLIEQTYHNFEWIIVNDGSTDNTDEIVLSFIANNRININYIKQENGGKHRAVNRGVKEAKGELFFIADSDDMLPNNALEKVVKIYEEIKDDNSFAGVCGLDGTFDGRMIGSGLPEEKIDDNAISIRYKLGVTGDMKEVFRTEVLKEFPFPEIEGECFCPEALVWNRIANKYRLRYVNQIIYLAEYQNNGITAGIVRARMNSPIASMMTYAEMTEYKEMPIRTKMKSAINYWRFYFCHRSSNNYPTLSWEWKWTKPIGWAMHLRDLKVNRK